MNQQNQNFQNKNNVNSKNSLIKINNNKGNYNTFIIGEKDDTNNLININNNTNEIIENKLPNQDSENNISINFSQQGENFNELKSNLKNIKKFQN